MVVPACTSLGQIFPKQPQSPNDSAPLLDVDPATLTNAIPRPELITRAGNKNPYTVLGKTYHLLASSEGYKERGVASWYGTKFQGRPTANGESYNLFAMTAAHRTLPIPAYVKVTNLKNNRAVIVRVNDRGPFHQDRIIDLSYAAAVKLGYVSEGTSWVEVEAIATDAKSAEDILTNDSQSVTGPLTSLDTVTKEKFFLQAGAFRRIELAAKLRMELLHQTQREVKVRADEPAGFYRVWVGPFADPLELQQVSKKLEELNMGKPQLISE